MDIRPGFAEAWQGLATALARLGRSREAATAGQVAELLLARADRRGP